jgi:hypothetical protein
MLDAIVLWWWLYSCQNLERPKNRQFGHKQSVFRKYSVFVDSPFQRTTNQPSLLRMRTVFYAEYTCNSITDVEFFLGQSLKNNISGQVEQGRQLYKYCTVKIVECLMLLCFPMTCDYSVDVFFYNTMMPQPTFIDRVPRMLITIRRFSKSTPEHDVNLKSQ